ncbi:von willebrand domain-containing protein [Gigaspora margarita]|uniref:von willebrand domain-containing protein n=1 Tax=Gigaspora margarita TaxID=4874 RepID=A0A8H4A531_GIGMA|nr:von willebrand domain-containing protein [Gigaspora margarita]
MKIQQAPFLIPPIYPGARFIVYCILEKGVEPCKEIILSAISQDGPMKLSIPLDSVALQGTKIHTLAARKLIQDLEEGTSFIHKHPRNKGNNISNSLIREQIVKLGVIYNLASKYTSFIAIDERGSELVSEAKIFSSQRIVPVAAARVSAPFSAVFKQQIKPSKLCFFGVPDSDFESSLGMSYVVEKSADFSSLIGSDDVSYDSLPASARKGRSYVVEKSADFGSLIDFDVDSYDSLPASVSLAASVKSKPPKIETLYSFLNFQSFDGSFLPSDKFYSWFGKNNFKDFESIGIKNEKILCLVLALAYLEIIMFDTFKEECEMCYIKAKKNLKKEVIDEQNVNENLEKAKEWVKKWADE